MISRDTLFKDPSIQTFTYRTLKASAEAQAKTSKGKLKYIWQEIERPVTGILKGKGGLKNVKEGLGNAMEGIGVIGQQFKQSTRPLTEEEAAQKALLYVRADVYPPTSPKPGSPIMLFIHGGGFMGSNRRDVCAPFISEARNIGFTVVSMDYRLAPETLLDGMLEDLSEVQKWLMKDLKKVSGIDVDPTKIIVVGSSAGAMLALSTPKIWAESPPSAIVSLYGPSDMRKVPFEEELSPRIVDLINAILPLRNKESLKKTSVTTHLSLETAAETSSRWSGRASSDSSGGKWEHPSSEVLENGTNYDSPPTGFDVAGAMTTAEKELSEHRKPLVFKVLSGSRLGEIITIGLLGEEGNRKIPKKLEGVAKEEILGPISPVVLATQYQFPPTYIVRCKDDDFFQAYHSKDLHKALTAPPFPVEDCPAIGEIPGLHAADNNIVELFEDQKKVLQWMKKKVGL